MSGPKHRPKGLHVYRSRGRVYVYAWRGGPRIKATLDTPEFYAEYAAALEALKQPQKGSTLAAVTQEYRQSQKFRKLAQATRADHERNFELILGKFGSADIEAFGDPRMRKEIRKWHEGMKHDRAADKALGTLSRILGFAVSDGLLSVNPALHMEKRYQREPNPVPWSDEDLKLFLKGAPAHLAHIARMAACTGFARADLAALSWSDVRRLFIERPRQKTGQGTRASLTDDLKTLIAEIGPKDPVEPILTNSRGKRWTSDGLGKSFDKRRRELGIRTTLHDLRAKRACTLFASGFRDEDVADEMGWSLQTVRHIRRHYVDQDALFARRVVRLRENTSGPKSV